MLRKYYRKREDEKFEEVDENKLLSEIDPKKLEPGEALKAVYTINPPTTMQELNTLIATLDIKMAHLAANINDINNSNPRKPERSDRVLWLEKCYDYNEAYRDMTDEEYEEELNRYNQEKAKWDQKAPEREEKIKELTEKRNGCDEYKASLINIRHGINEKMREYIEQDKIYNAFCTKLQNHNTRRYLVEFKNIANKEMDNLYNHPEIPTHDKNTAYLTILLNCYSSILNQPGTTSRNLFGIFKVEGSKYARDIREFCKDMFGVELPAQLNNNKPLLINDLTIVDQAKYDSMLIDTTTKAKPLTPRHSGNSNE